MSFTYDPSTDVGRVRLLIKDKAEPALFSDEELEALLSMEGGSVFLAAANALDAIATDQVMVMKVIKLVGSLETDGAKVAASIREQAESLRRRANAVDGAIVDIATMNLGPSSAVDIWLRENA